MEDKRQHLQDLLSRYALERQQYVRSSSTYNETQLRADYLDEFLEILGWDVKNRRGAPQYLREVILEDRVEIEEDDAESLRKKPDYALRLNTVRKFFVEAKKPRVHIENDRSAAFQVKRYGWNAGLSISVLSNFDKLVIYDCRTRPNHEDDVSVGRLKVYDYSEYLSRFDEIYEQLSQASVYSGQFDALFPVESEQSGTQAFDQYFLEQIERWRVLLSVNLAQKNPALTEGELNFLVQRLINRIVFLRICEDRELEKYKTLYEVANYEDLKRLFQSADRRYNSGLFNFVEDRLSFDVELDGSVLVDIFKELYFPQSPYAFSVVEAGMLGRIYEMFLGREIRLSPDVRVVEKPEVVASGGIVPTPPFIVENIVARTVEPSIHGKSPSQLSGFCVADICCGSGAFLLAVYDRLLNHYLEWYVNNRPEEHRDKLYQGAQGIWYLMLPEKKRILLTHIFGVDVDLQAVEVTQFSLLLKTLENESNAAVQDYTSRYRIGALPKLDNNIQHGNSLVDLRYFAFNEDAVNSETLIGKISPFDWQSRFPDVMRHGGFDVIVGNPPYVRIQNLVRYSAEEVEYYQAKESPFQTGRSDNFDKYALFVERAVDLLRPGGILGYIVPNKFFTIRSGKSLRKLLADKKHLSEITHFGELQVFGKYRTTYTCILIVAQTERERFSVEHVRDLDLWIRGQTAHVAWYDANSIGEAPWEFTSPEAATLFQRLRRENPTTLGEVATIFVGVQTSADRLFILKSSIETPVLLTFEDVTSKRWTIEKAILRPALLDVELPAFSRPQANAWIIFPYRVDGDAALLYSVEEMQERFPDCWQYLQHHEARLKARNLQRAQQWYGYGRIQSLTKFNGTPKLVWPVLSLEPRYAYDDQDILFTGGGNGPYYGLRPLPGNSLSIFYLQAILSHPVIDLMVRSVASTFRGGYKSHGKQFVENLPIRAINFNISKEKTAYDNIVDAITRLIEATTRLRLARLPQQRRTLETQINLLKNRINRAVEQLYGIEPGELRAIPELQSNE